MGSTFSSYLSTSHQVLFISAGLEVDYISVKSEKISDLADQLEADADWFVIGSPMPEGILKQKASSVGHGRKKLKSVYSFYHNPYVNRMWSKLSLYLYVTE